MDKYYPLQYYPLKPKSSLLLPTIIILIISTGLGFLICWIVKRINENYEKEHYDPRLDELIKEVETLGISTNGLKFFSDEKSFTINKRKVHMCLFNENKQYYSNNTLMYVLLHELAHVKCKSIGHTPEFHHIFDEYLDLAIKKGLYNPHKKIPTNYCEF